MSLRVRPISWGLRDYGVAGQLGLEKTPEEFVDNMVGVFREVRRILRSDGTLWLNMGDSYQAGKGMSGGAKKYAAGEHVVDRKNPARRFGIRPNDRPIDGLKPKDLIGVPWMLALALRADGWYLRQEIIWSKPNAMPESVRDRPSRAHEQVFLLSKSPRYYYDEVAERKPQKTAGERHEGKSGYRDGHPSKGGVKVRALNPLGGAVRSVWSITSRSFKGAHFATMPPGLAARCIRLGSSARGCCRDCGAPWWQVIERDRVATRPGTKSKVNRASCHDDSPYHGHNGSVIGNRDPQRHQTTVRVLGWESSCTCLEREPVPCTVFDPFGGAMTTLVAADALGRNGIATELSEEYLKLGAERLSRPHAPARKPASAPAKPMPLFSAREDR